MNHKGTVEISTDRLILRRITMEDAGAAFSNWMGDERVTKFLRWPTHRSIEDSKYIIKEWLNSYENPAFYLWTIVLKELGEAIGSISAVDMDERAEKVHIGYCIGSRWWHMGYTSEAFSALIPFFFEEVKAKRIEAQHDPENPNSGRVMAKCGLIYEGTLRKADWSNRGIVDACMYGILDTDYFGGRQ